MPSVNVVPLSTPLHVLEEMERLRQQLAVRQNDFEAASAEFVTLHDEYLDRHSTVLLETDDAKTMTERKAEATKLMAAQPDRIYQRRTEAEARVEKHKAAFRSIEAQISLCQSILKRMDNV